MLKLAKIAITGGVASGKSAVCQFFQEMGAYVVNADAIVHELLDSDLGKQLLLLFGHEIVENGKLNRKRIADIAFKDPQKLKKLEALLHPAVLEKIEELYIEACRSEKYSSFVVEIPLLFEIQGESFYDVVVAILSDESKARARFAQGAEEYDRRMKRQLSPSQKDARADYTIFNNGTLADLKKEVVELYKKLKRAKKA
jgi:dephospho-CoA kinase